MRIDLNSDRGEQFDFVGAITKPTPGPPYPTAAWTNFTVVFAARDDRTNTVKVLKSSANVTEISLGGAGTGAYTIHIKKADTSALTQATLWEYDVTLIEPDGTENVVCSGRWAIGEASST